jgi:hypothetical protein
MLSHGRPAIEETSVPQRKCVILAFFRRVLRKCRDRMTMRFRNRVSGCVTAPEASTFLVLQCLLTFKMRFAVRDIRSSS